jgi:hypothetical protein
MKAVSLLRWVTEINTARRQRVTDLESVTDCREDPATEQFATVSPLHGGRFPGPGNLFRPAVGEGRSPVEGRRLECRAEQFLTDDGGRIVDAGGWRLAAEGAAHPSLIVVKTRRLSSL